MQTILDEILNRKGFRKSPRQNYRYQQPRKPYVLAHSIDCNCPRCDSVEDLRDSLCNTTPLDDILSETGVSPTYKIEDYTRQATPSKCAETRNGQSCVGRNRKLEQINAVVLHQTAGRNTNDISAYLWVGIHFVVLPNGRIIQLYPESRIVYHANSFNNRSVGIEFAGTFPNERGICWWRCIESKKDANGKERCVKSQYVKRGHTERNRSCAEPTPQQIKAGRYLLTALKSKIPSIKYVLAHRQASGTRDNDPGPTTWLQVGEWAKRNLGLTDGGNYKEGTGNPIPPSWRQGAIIP